MDLTDPVAAALVVAEALERAGVPHALYGGLLLAAYGEPRETRDVDLAVVDARVDDVRAALAAAGADTEPVFASKRFGGQTVDRITLLGGEGDVGLNTLDLVRPRSARYAAAALQRAAPAPLRGREIRVLTPEDFVVFKLLSTRERDLLDAASVLKRSAAALDRGAVATEVERLAAEIPDFDLRARWKALGG